MKGSHTPESVAWWKLLVSFCCNVAHPLHMEFHFHDLSPLTITAYYTFSLYPGTHILTNDDRRGLRKYGVIGNWPDEGRRRLGVYLLHEAYLQYTYQRDQCSQSMMEDDPRLMPSVMHVPSLL